MNRLSKQAMQDLMDLHLVGTPIRDAESKKFHLQHKHIRKDGSITLEGESAARNYAAQKHARAWANK